MNYKAGDTVVCINAQKIFRPTLLVAGKLYVVAFTDGRDCTSVEGVGSTQTGKCGLCDTCGCETGGLGHFFPSRFIKLDPLVKDDEIEDAISRVVPEHA